MTDETQVAVREDARITPGAALTAAIELAQNPNTRIEVITGLFDLQRRLETDQEERALSDAIQAIQGAIPPVPKNGKIPKKNKDGGETFIPFATFEDVMAGLQPFLNEHGIAITYTSEFTNLKFVVTATARRGRATIAASVPLPIDEGPGRNTTQAHVSSLSYGKRNAVESLFNIIRIGADNDGSTAHDKVLTEEQVTELVELLKVGGGSEPSLLVKFYGDKVRALTDAPAGDYGKLKNTIEQRNRAVKAAAAQHLANHQAKEG